MISTDQESDSGIGMQTPNEKSAEKARKLDESVAKVRQWAVSSTSADKVLVYKARLDPEEEHALDRAETYVYRLKEVLGEDLLTFFMSMDDLSKVYYQPKTLEPGRDLSAVITLIQSAEFKGMREIGDLQRVVPVDHGSRSFIEIRLDVRSDGFPRYLYDFRNRVLWALVSCCNRYVCPTCFEDVKFGEALSETASLDGDDLTRERSTLVWKPAYVVKQMSLIESGSLMPLDVLRESVKHLARSLNGTVCSLCGNLLLRSSDVYLNLEKAEITKKTFNRITSNTVNDSVEDPTYEPSTTQRKAKSSRPVTVASNAVALIKRKPGNETSQKPKSESKRHARSSNMSLATMNNGMARSGIDPDSLIEEICITMKNLKRELELFQRTPRSRHIPCCHCVRGCFQELTSCCRPKMSPLQHCSTHQALPAQLPCQQTAFRSPLLHGIASTLRRFGRKYSAIAEILDDGHLMMKVAAFFGLVLTVILLSSSNRSETRETPEPSLIEILMH